MGERKYGRAASLNCPTCGCGDYGMCDGPEGTLQIVACAACGREMTKDELLHENSENIGEHVREIGAEVVKDAVAAMRKSIRKALRGSKYIKVR